MPFLRLGGNKEYQFDILFFIRYRFAEFHDSTGALAPMPDKLPLPTKRRPAFFLTATVLSGILTAPAAFATETAEAWDFGPKPPLAGKSSAQDHMIEGVFDARWREAPQAYAVDKHGRLREEADPVSISASTASWKVNTSARSNTKVSQFDILESGQATTEDGRCGPSLTSTDDIVRLVKDAALKYGVDERFALAIATVESRLDRFRNSPKGARGTMQLMPATAAQLGVADICDPADNIDGAVRFMGICLPPGAIR
ncbi:transglycosylase SLT domain-containing protein [Mesorhizobium sp. B1-1-8]|uniref:transglycosylase SLT domain-containing protein n=1 Tax=Mesorhizobium sp. B1-1-8 TaxID=2589976 RepID=UPI001D01B223|nr:transglycosylase SLT domain-containing protein [Mesorhizobium sp. B1-1-8]UCI10727.1 transglycosylase SLT domain-containing protein [Mesorhizobium sp. B1-1-8]